ncbi:MAG: alpha/beta hydrolase, partial [Gemmatimonadota bacterium]|nr:alpha/beta hydrolase [Gemmatimonadota bacterium]
MKSPSPRPSLAPALVALSLWCLAGPGLATTESPTASFQPIDFEARGGETVSAERGTLRVPENRTDPESRTIELAFVRFAATTDEPGPPIVLLAGGPGGSGIDAARSYRFELLMGLRELGDVIALDQRGTGESEPEMDCGDAYSLPLDRPLDRATAGATLAVAAARCTDRLAAQGIDLAGY